MPEPASNAAAAGLSSHDRILLAAKQLFAQRGYENTSTVAIARAAGTSESQLMKHFGSKEGLLEAIFERGWTAMAPSLAQLREIDSPRDRLRSLLDLVIKGLEGDPDLKELMLLEGRRIRRQGNAIMTTTGFLQFIRTIDAIIAAMAASGQLRPGIKPDAFRSGLVGMFEGMLRDQLLAQRVGYPAAYTTPDIRTLFDAVIAAFVK